MSDQTSIQSSRQEMQFQYALRAEIARASDEIFTSQRPQYFAEKLAGSKLKKNQVRNLESVAYTTDKFSDITDLIKKVTGRDSKKEGWGKDNAGVELIDELEALRDAEAKPSQEKLSKKYSQVVDPDLLRRLHIELCREFVKHLAAHYLYLTRDRKE